MSENMMLTSLRSEFYTKLIHIRNPSKDMSWICMDFYDKDKDDDY